MVNEGYKARLQALGYKVNSNCIIDLKVGLIGKILDNSVELNYPFGEPSKIMAALGLRGKIDGEIPLMDNPDLKSVYCKIKDEHNIMNNILDEITKIFNRGDTH